MTEIKDIFIDALNTLIFQSKHPKLPRTVKHKTKFLVTYSETHCRSLGIVMSEPPSNRPRGRPDDFTLFCVSEARMYLLTIKSTQV